MNFDFRIVYVLVIYCQNRTKLKEKAGCHQISYDYFTCSALKDLRGKFSLGSLKHCFVDQALQVEVVE